MHHEMSLQGCSKDWRKFRSLMEEYVYTDQSRALPRPSIMCKLKRKKKAHKVASISNYSSVDCAIFQFELK